MMARLGRFDWLVIDMEHTAIDTASMAELIRVVDLAGCVPLVRVGANDPLLIKRALDCGAGGILVPNVSTVEQARAAVSAAHYPPIGTRGVGLSRAQDYGMGFDAYRARAGEIVVVIQIEHRDAVRDLDSILAVPGLDAFMIGPYDLSGSFGKPGQFDDPEVAASLETVRGSMKRHTVAGGIHIVQPDAEMLKRRLAEGYRFIAYGVDQLFLASTIDAQSKAIAKIRDVS